MDLCRRATRGGWLIPVFLLAACVEEPRVGARVRLELEVQGGRPGGYLARVVRADGLAVSEWKAKGRAVGEGERVVLEGACDPSLEAQPNRFEITPEAVPGIVDPGVVVLPFACDGAEVRLARGLGLGRVAESFAWLGGQACSASASVAEGVTVSEVGCAPEVALDDVRLECDGIEAIVPLDGGASGPVSRALPWAEVAVTVSPGQARVEVVPLYRDVRCTVRWRFGVGGLGVYPIAHWEVDEEVGPIAIEYGRDPTFERDFAFAVACAPACEPGRCGEDGCGRPCCAAGCEGAWCALPEREGPGWLLRSSADGTVIEAVVDPVGPVGAGGGSTPADGVLVVARAGDVVWEIFAPVSGEAVALRDGQPVSIAAGIGADGRLRVEVPEAVSAVAFAGGSRATPGGGRRLEVVAAGRDGLLRARLVGVFPTPFVARAEGVALEVAQSEAVLSVELGAAEGFELEAGWAMERGWCEAIGLCASVVVGDRLGPLMAPRRAVIDEAGDPAEVRGVIDLWLAGAEPSVAPVALGERRLIVHGTGREVCWIASPVAAGERIAVGAGDGAALVIGEGGEVVRRGGASRARGGRSGAAVFACDESVGVDTRIWTPSGVARAAIAPSGAGVARASSGLELVALWGADEGWADAGEEVEVFAAGVDGQGGETRLVGEGWSTALESDGTGVWRARLPAAVAPGEVWLARGTSRSNAVWLPLAGGDGDGDGVPDARDDCPGLAQRESERADRDGDGVGDACDVDADGDGWHDAVDRCPGVNDPEQADADGDEVGDACDRFPADPEEWADADGDGLGDRSEGARCGDGRVDAGLGEECDDANEVAGDGCEPGCRLACGRELGAVRAIRDVRSGHCLFTVGERADFATAEARCQRQGGHVAIPDDAVENAYVFALGGGWLGIGDALAEGDLETLGGAAPAFSSWAFNEPASANDSLGYDGGDEDCVAMLDLAATWEDLACEETRGFVCEQAERACGDGVRQAVLGEECDDGNTLRGDGCTPECRLGCRPPHLGGVVPPEIRGSVSRPGGDGCLLELAAALTWSQAKTRCEALGGYLAVPDDEAEHALVDSFGRGWLGLHDAGENGEVWTIFGRPAGYTRFAAGEPDGTRVERCIARQREGTWIDVACDEPQPALCETRMEACGDGVVQATLGERCDAGGAPERVCEAGCRLGCGPLPDDWTGLRDAASGACLVATGQSGTWVDAMAVCEAAGGYPVVPDDSEELARVIALGYGWLGVSEVRAPGVLATVKREYPAYLPSRATFDDESPTDRCHAIGSTLAWTDRDCARTAHIVCELEAEPCGDGVIQVASGEACEGAGCGPDCAAPCASEHDPDLAFRGAVTGRCVYGFAEALTWSSAAARCAATGGVLYVPREAGEDALAADFGVEAWIGLSDVAEEGRFVDGAGTPAALGFWGGGVPDDGLGFATEDCAVMRADGAWDDVGCDELRGVICERD